MISLVILLISFAVYVYYYVKGYIPDKNTLAFKALASTIILVVFCGIGGETFGTALFSFSFGLHIMMLQPVHRQEQEDDAKIHRLQKRLQHQWDENNEREQDLRTPADTYSPVQTLPLEFVHEEENMQRREQDTGHLERYAQRR